MAELEVVRFSELPGAAPLSGPELIPMVQNGATVIRSASSIVLEAGLQTHIDAVDPHPQYEFRVKSNLTATVDPSTTNDSTEGYEPTSRWVNTVTNEFFICINNSVGSANWQQATLTLDELGSAALADTGAGNGLDADLLDGQHGSYYLDYDNFANKPVFDNYVGWSLNTNGVDQGNIGSNGVFRLNNGSHVTITYSEVDSSVTITSADTDLGQSRDSESYTVTSSTGTDTTLLAATDTNAGVMTAGDKAALDSLVSSGGGGGGVPIGAVILWSGSILEIPSGWVICDGLNGTPDLTNRFVVGAGDVYDVGVVGGSADAVVVSHSHSGSTGTDGFHSHSGSTGTAGSHVHSIGWNQSGNGMSHFSTTRAAAGNDVSANSVESGVINANGNHTHTVSIVGNGNHTHTVTVNSIGESGVDKNLPPYYALAYIMKT